MNKKVIVGKKVAERNVVSENPFAEAMPFKGLAEVDRALISRVVQPKFSTALVGVLVLPEAPVRLAPVSEELIAPEERELTTVTGSASRDQGWTKLKDAGTVAITLPIGFSDRIVSV